MGLLRRQTGGPVGLDTIATSLSEEPETIEDVAPEGAVDVGAPEHALTASNSLPPETAFEQAPGQARALAPEPPPAATPQNEREVFATTFIRAALPLTGELRMPSSPNEVREFVRQSALDRGIDPDVAVRVVLSEGGMTPATWTGDHGSSFGPFQLHYGGMAPSGNAVAGLGDAFTAETHLRANDPSTWRQQVEWALDRAARNGWTAWHGVAGVGLGPRDGIGVASRQTYAGPMLPNGAHQHVSVPNQFAAQLSVQEAYAACGPVAAVAIARFLGRNPTVVEALQTAKQTGWTSSGGMNGIANEKRLLDAMHIPAQMELPVNWRHVQTDASRGTPVIVSTPNHYWVVDDYDPLTREYHVGQSGLAFRGGAEWMTAERIQQLGGGINGALYIDHPLAGPAAPVVVTSVAEAPPHALPPAVGHPGRAERWWEDPATERHSALRSRNVWV